MPPDEQAVNSISSDYPQPPFSFKSLPVELRSAVIEAVSSNPSSSIAELREEDRETLKALSLADRECGKWASAILWRVSRRLLDREPSLIRLATSKARRVPPPHH